MNPCPECGVILGSYAGLETHIQIRHVNPVQHTCKLCPLMLVGDWHAVHHHYKFKHPERFIEMKALYLKEGIK